MPQSSAIAANRFVYNVTSAEEYGVDMSRWPSFSQVNVNEQFGSQLQLCDNENGWLSVPRLPLRNGHARAKVRLQGNKVQIALPFLITVVLDNFVKVICIFMTLRTCSSNHIITVGDAVASFLETPDVDTNNKCLRTQRQLLEWKGSHSPQVWHSSRQRMATLIGGKRIWTIVNLYVCHPAFV